MMDAKFTDTCDDTNIVCPYCGESYQPEAEDYSEDDNEEKCDKCEKKFYSHQSFSVTHYSTPDCELNNEPHVWRPVQFKEGGTHDFCAICDRCRPIAH